MSLEAALQENTEVMKRLIAVFDKQALTGEVKADAKPKADTKRPLPPTDSGPIKETVDYEKHIKPAALALAAKKGRDALIETLKPFGAATAKDVAAEKFPELLKALQAAVA